MNLNHNEGFQAMRQDKLTRKGLEAEIASLKAQLAECKKDAERWKMASTSRNFGITNWCEYGQRTSYDSFATKLIDGAIAAQKEKA